MKYELDEDLPPNLNLRGCVFKNERFSAVMQVWTLLNDSQAYLGLFLTFLLFSPFWRYSHT